MRRSEAQAQLQQIFERLPHVEQLAIRCCVLGDSSCRGDLSIDLMTELYDQHRVSLGCWSPWTYPTLAIIVARVAVSEQLEDRRYSRRDIAKLVDRKDLNNRDYNEQFLPPLHACRHVLKYWLRSVEGALDAI